jgi:AraC family L-rhamnose operon regulatory protein RhaS
MKRYVRYDPFDIYSFEVAEWPHPVHKHTYCEIIFIRGGAGRHFINSNCFDYQAGDVFLLGPEDYHYFEITQSTRFCYIRFTGSFITASANTKEKHWRAMLEHMLRAPYQAGGSIMKGEEDKKQLYHLLEVLLYEYDNKHHHAYEMVVDSLLKVMLSIISRNLLRQDHLAVAGQPNAASLESLLHYIRTNIYSPEKLRIDTIAAHFSYSKNYLSPYFKKQTGESLQLYILKHKLSLIESRLRYSSTSLSEIAHEFGFTDLSHLYKLFKKYYGLAPRDYRAAQATSEEASAAQQALVPKA